MGGFRRGSRCRNIYISPRLCYNGIMVMLINKKIKICGIIMLLMVGLFGMVINSTVEAYICKEGDTKCEEAKKNMQDNQAAATNYTKKANSVGELIEQLNGEISSLNKVISENEAKIAKLNKEIEKTEQKLEDEQSALAELLVNMHFESDAEPIRILAGATSISDLAEKAARDEVVKQEIATASDKVKAAKEELSREKAEVETTLKQNEESRGVLAVKKDDQKKLKESYEKNADSAEVAAAYWEKQVQALAWTPPANTLGYGSRWAGSGNTYTYRDNCPQDNLMYGAYGGAVCQCTSYASYKAQEKWDIVNDWGDDAWAYIYGGGRRVPKNGATTYVDSVPAPYTIAIWPVSSMSPFGHVAWVESVNSDGSINISEYNVNWAAIGCYIGDYCSRSGVGSAGVSFLHFE